METPQKAAPQSARKSSKHHKPRTDTQKSVQSDNDVYLNTPQGGDKTPSKKNRKARAASNARRNGVQSDIGDFQEHESGHRHASYSGKPKNTPAKAIKSDAYAGPTFHQSPAASAIPLPSFMPRSLPNPSRISTIAETGDGSTAVKQTTTVAEKREITPLDWMFDAARQARGTPNGASPARRRSPHTQSPAPSPGIRKEETDFPFELEGDDDGGNSVYTTPLSQRFAASKTPQSTSEGGQTLTEEERQAKTAALKKALMNSGAPAQLGSPFNDNNPFNARNAPPSNAFSPRQTSNPPTPAYQNGYAAANPQYSNYNPTSPSRNFSNQSTSRPPSSNLRNVYDPNFAAPPMSPPNTGQDQQRVSTARSPPPQRQLNYSTNFGAIYGQLRPASEGSQPGRNPKPSLEQGLDDLRKVLNLSTLGQQQ